MSKGLPHRTSQVKVDRFKAWLADRGAEVLPPTNPYEVVRFRGDGETSIVYRNEAGVLTTWTGQAAEAYRAFRATNSEWRAGQRVKARKTPADVKALIARDGCECWYCGGRFPPEGEPAADPGLERTVEHLVSTTHSGPNHISNKVLAHQKCNWEAGNLSVAEKVRLREKMRASR